MLKNIEEKNRQFKKMSLANQRIAVAKDVLIQLDRGKYRPKTGTYLVIHRNIFYPFSLQEELRKKNPPVCEVCAVGALFASTARKKGGLTENSLFSSEYSFGMFSVKQMQLMEAAFEIDYQYAVDRSSKINKRAVEFGRKYKGNTYKQRKSRLRAIMKNVIKNNGMFRP